MGGSLPECVSVWLPQLLVSDCFEIAFLMSEEHNYAILVIGMLQQKPPTGGSTYVGEFLCDSIVFKDGEWLQPSSAPAVFSSHSMSCHWPCTKTGHVLKPLKAVRCHQFFLPLRSTGVHKALCAFLQLVLVSDWVLLVVCP